MKYNQPMTNSRIQKALTITAILSLAYYAVLTFISPSLIGFQAVWLLLSLVLMFFAWRISKRPKDSRFTFSATGKPLYRIPLFYPAALVLLAGTAFSSFTAYRILTPLTADGNTATEYLIVLGGGIRVDGTLTELPKKRCRRAAEFMKQHPETKAIVTGGTLRMLKFAEAPEMAKTIIDCGIQPERIIIEDQAQDTIQNFKYSAGLIAQDKGIPVSEAIKIPVTVITSDFHLSRAQELARRLGFTSVSGIKCSTPWISALNVNCREICAWLKLELRILLTGEPAAMDSTEKN